MSVGIVNSQLEDVKDNLKKLFGLINYQPKKKKIFLKPNIVAPQPPETGVITHPLLISALVEIFQEQGYEVVIGEGASVAQDTQKVFDMTDYSSIAKRYGIELINLDKAERIECEWKYGKLKLPKLIDTHEYINVAKMKTHIETKVSLGMKNQKGLLLPNDKRKFHLKYYLHEAVNELSKIVTPNLTIIDGIIALEGDGPGRAGDPLDMGVLMAGTNLIEVDNVAYRIMGFDKDEIDYIPIYENIQTVGLNIDDVKREFKKPKDKYASFKNINFYNMRACSGCIESFAAGFARADKSKFMKPINVLAGKEAKLNSNINETICYGDCTKKFASEYSLIHISGCPPQPIQVVNIPNMLNGKD
ncbi:DUF362 domain-containing protein [Clostridium beijerinckii]|uniref:DUF362 domain-containing protein n=1 Tax=Clostridium beijerinckii TaxID=1520 RepID=A0A1S8SKY2_CLOBE|nr:DUF362 domain-containing protein [Clostridium beijerinckii]NRY61550.1 uncharacterized protein (DUF362 family) [Clostridium beijerinckii]OOM65855.1 hypothetical protein CLBCK_02310 [Clostridium beijerinckii]